MKNQSSQQRAPKTAQMQRTIQKVIDATLELLTEIGYRNLTINLISTRSGVARSTIYRHWDNIVELTRDALDSAIGPSQEIQRSADLRTDLIRLYRGVAKSLEQSVWGLALPALIEASHNDPNFEGLIQEMAKERRAAAKRMLVAAKKNGELAEDANIEWILDALAGPLYHRILITGKSVNNRLLIEKLVDGVLAAYGVEA